MQPVRALQSTGKSKACFTWHYAFVKNSLLFNRSEKSRAYRENLFSDNNVLAMINLSVYRKFLFDHASGPAAAIIYTPKKEEISQPIIYCTPKPTYTIEDVRKFSIDPTDICRIPRDIIDDDK